MLTLYWISLIICAIVCIPLFSHPEEYLEECIPEEYQTEKYCKIILSILFIGSIFPVINTIMAIYIIIQICKMIF